MFKQLLSRTGQGGVENDANCGALREISPVSKGGASPITITANDFLRGFVITNLTGAALYNIDSATNFDLAAPDWPIGATASCFISNTNAAITSMTFGALGGITSAIVSISNRVGLRLVTLRKDGPGAYSMWIG